MPRLFAILALLATFALPSCIEGEEEIWLKRDGSGRLEATYKMPNLVMNSFGGAEKLKKTLEAAAAADDYVNLTRVAHKTEKGSVTFEFAGTFTSFPELCSFPQRRLRDPAEPDKPVQAEALFGESKLEINKLSIELSRKVDISGILPKNIKNSPALLRDSNFHYTVHLPVATALHDAHKTSSDGKTLEWTFLLKDHTSTSMNLYAKAPLPLPWWIWFAAALLLLAFLAILFLAARRLILLRK